MLQYVAACCSMLQHVTAFCRTLQDVAVSCSLLQLPFACHHPCSPPKLLQLLCDVRIAACCSTLQHVAAYCSMLQHVVVCCSALPYDCPHHVYPSVFVFYCSVLQRVAACCSALQCVAGHPSVFFFHLCPSHVSSAKQHSNCLERCVRRIIVIKTLQHIATHCNTLQRTATHCNALQRTATH